jgi:hypothetical protein
MDEKGSKAERSADDLIPVLGPAAGEVVVADGF